MGSEEKVFRNDSLISKICYFWVNLIDRPITWFRGKFYWQNIFTKKPNFFLKKNLLIFLFIFKFKILVKFQKMLLYQTDKNIIGTMKNDVECLLSMNVTQTMQFAIMKPTFNTNLISNYIYFCHISCTIPTLYDHFQIASGLLPYFFFKTGGLTNRSFKF